MPYIYKIKPYKTGMGRKQALQSELSAVLLQAKHLYLDAVQPLPQVHNEQKTVIFMPGYCAPPFAMRGLADVLVEHNMRVVRWLHCFWEALEDCAGRVADSLERNYAAKNRRFSVVGHSLGGLVIRQALQMRPWLETTLDNLVFLATPHQGTYLAYTNCLIPSCHDMIPDSPYLQKLNSKPLPDVPITNLAVRHDLVVQPYQYSILPEAKQVENIILKDTGHLGVTLAYEHILRGLQK